MQPARIASPMGHVHLRLLRQQNSGTGAACPGSRVAPDSGSRRLSADERCLQIGLSGRICGTLAAVKRRLAAAIIAAALVSGCATTAPMLSELRPAPPTREYAFRTPKAGNDAMLTVLRDSAFAGSAVAYHLIVNGELAARIRAGEFVRLYVPSGDVVIEVRHPSAHFGAIGDSASLTAEPRGRYFYRINSDLGQIKLLRTTASSVGAP